MRTQNLLSSCRRRSNTPLSRFLAIDSPTKRPRPLINTAIILNRSPLITRAPTIFERAYYSYQSRIRRALHNPFPYDFYFKQGSPLEIQFNAEERKRERKAFGYPFGKEENVVEKGETEPEEEAFSVGPDEQREGAGEKIMPRRHEADESGDIHSLDRRGQRNLYLLLQQKVSNNSIWRFPQGVPEKGHLLHHAAQGHLSSECGQHMDTWIVARNPIGVLEKPPPVHPQKGSCGALTFFFKAHILAGQVRPNPESIQDFAWLTKEEIKPKVEHDYWMGVKDMLADF